MAPIIPPQADDGASNMALAIVLAFLLGIGALATLTPTRPSQTVCVPTSLVYSETIPAQ